MSHTISTVDGIVIFAYFFCVLVIGAYFSRHSKTSTDYFLAGRNVGWLAVGASLFSSNISSESILVYSAAGASIGLAVGHFEWLAVLGVLLLGWVFVPLYLKSGVFTVPELLEKRYNYSSRVFLTTVSLIVYIFTKISVTLFAGGFLLNKILGWDIVISSVILVIFTGLYTIAGGLYAVIYTGLAQTIVLLTGAFILTFSGLIEVGGMSGLQAQLPADFFQMFKSVHDPNFPWTGILLGAPIIAIWYWCTDQFVIQRVLASKNINHARKGSVLSGFLKIVSVFILIVPGLVACVLFPEISANDAFPTLVTSHLVPYGLRGFVISGLLAAIMSSLASCFNSCSALFTMDYYKHFKPQARENEVVLIGRLATAVLVLVAILWVPLIRSINSDMFFYLLRIPVYFCPSIAAVFVFGLFWQRSNSKAAISTLFFGVCAGGLRLLLEILSDYFFIHVHGLMWFIQMNILHFVFIVFVLSAIILVFVSFFSKVSEKENKDRTYFTLEHSFSDLKKKTAPAFVMPGVNVLLSLLLIVALITLWGIYF